MGDSMVIPIDLDNLEGPQVGKTKTEQTNKCGIASKKGKDILDGKRYFGRSRGDKGDDIQVRFFSNTTTGMIESWQGDDNGRGEMT
jgi:hypothetical protein